MSQRRKTWKPWGDHPVVVLIIVVGTLIGIVVALKALLPGQTEISLPIRVADPSGASLGGAKVILSYSGGPISDLTDNDGMVTFPLAGRNLKNVRVIVERDPYQIYEREFQPKSNDILNIRLEERKGNQGSIILRTVDANSSGPIPNASVSLVANGNLQKEVTDSDGFAKFILEFPAEGPLDVQISVSAKGYQIENQIATLYPEKLQYVLLSPNSLSVQIPAIPTSSQEGNGTADSGNETAQLNGSGVDITEEAGGSGLRIIMLKPDFQPWQDVYLEVLEQLEDVNGNPVRGNKVQSGRINQQGLVEFELNEGTFVVCVDDGASPGYNWTERECIYNIEVTTGKRNIVRLQPGQLEVAVSDSSGGPLQNVYYEVYTQKDDVNGHPVTDKLAVRGNTNNAGLGYAVITPGLYTLQINDIRGYNWGDTRVGKGKLNIPIEKGKTYQIFIRLGQMLVGLRDPSGQPAVNVYIEVYTQKDDINGKHILAELIWRGNTDTGGFASVDLTKGLYALKIGENILYDIPIEEGKVTQTDGSSITE